MRKGRKVLALLAMAAITAGALAGCGSGAAADTGSSASVNGSSAAGTETAAAAEAAEGGHVLNIAKLAALQACDPHKVNDPMSNEP